MGIQCEILAPVGNLNDLVPIIDAGADAVYIGLRGFSARPVEADFYLEELPEAISIAHEMGKKIYIAVNGTVKQTLMGELFDNLSILSFGGADAFIMSDFGMIRHYHSLNIETPVHASTLLGVYNSETIKWLREMGTTRIILSSDLYINEIADLIQAAPGLEYEIVADGGVCFNSNRQCLLPHFSTMETYQVCCQLDYDLYKEGNKIGDAKRIGNCRAIIHRNMGLYLGMGVMSYKIEGRTNAIEYIIKRTREMKESKAFYLEHYAEIPGYMHYALRNADWKNL